jgi:glycosyltransferase involved in cell wall biosynthesis
MKTQPKVSIVVPVHNAEQYFEKCLQSLINQTLRDIEIILVLDHPTDGTDKIAELYATQDYRIKLIYNEQSLHTGYSRNKGMAAATGEYIGFADHDDYLDLTMLEKMYGEAAKEDAEVAVCGIYKCVDNNIKPWDSFNEFVSKEQLISDILQRGSIHSFVWNHLYKKSFIDTHDLKFEDTTSLIGEDLLFNMSMSLYSPRFVYLAENLYTHIYYEQSTGALTAHLNPEKEVNLMIRIKQFLQKNNLYETDKILFSEFATRNLYARFHNQIIKKTDTAKIKQFISYTASSPIMSDLLRMFRPQSWRTLCSKPMLIVFILLLLVNNQSNNNQVIDHAES